MVTATFLASCTKTTQQATVTQTATQTNTQTTTQTTTTTKTSSTTTTTASNEPQYGGSLNVMTFWGNVEPPGFDVSLAPAVYKVTAWNGPFLDWLMVGDVDKYGPRGNNQFAFQTAQYVPSTYLGGGGVATSWEITGNPVTITFHIRKGIMWAGNSVIGMQPRELTADDVAWSLNRGMAAPILKGVYNFVDSVTATDKYTVVIKCNTFNANWAYYIGYGYVPGMINCPEAGNSTVGAGSEDWKNQVSDGPFILTSYVAGAACTYERNPNYWGTTTINGKSYQLPFIDKLVYPIIPDPTTAVASLRTGKLDWWPYTPNTNAASLKQTAPNLIQTQVPGGGITCVMVNRLDNQYLKSLAVRQALLIATDFKSINHLVYPGGAEFSYPLPPSDPAYTPFDQLPASTQNLFSYDPTKAKQMLADAGYPNGFKLTLNVNSAYPDFADIAQLLADEWSKVNVQLTINTITPAANAAAKLNRGFDLQLHVFNVNNPITSLSNLIPQPGNLYLSTEPLAQNFQKILTDLDAAKLVADEKQVAVDMLADGGYIPFANPVVLNCHWPWMKNYYSETDAGYATISPLISRMWVDQNMKKSMGY